MRGTLAENFAATRLRRRHSMNRPVSTSVQTQSIFLQV